MASRGASAFGELPLGVRPQVTVHLVLERLLIREEAIEHLPGLFERLAEVEHLLELRAGIGHRGGIDVLEEDEDLGARRSSSSGPSPGETLLRCTS